MLSPDVDLHGRRRRCPDGYVEELEILRRRAPHARMAGSSRDIVVMDSESVCVQEKRQVKARSS
jgi:hypothetical protein